MTTSQAAAPLAVTLFGPMQVCVDGQPLTPLRSRKSLWLLALLALLALRHGRPVEREWLAETLWPDAGTDQSLTSLRTVLCELRQALGREGRRVQSPNRHSLCLELGGMFIDLLEFDAAKGSREAAALKQAVALYRGPLLEGCTEEWVAQERMAREQDCLRALQALADTDRAAGDLESATGYHRLAVGLNPWRESAQRGLMQALSESGDGNAALNVYQVFVRLLHKDNPQASPDQKTTALYSSLRAESRRRASQPPRPAAQSHTAAEADPVPAVAGYVPYALTDLIGRKEEQAKVAERLRRFRLVTLTGPGGIGKTRLALSVASETAFEYPDGVWLVSLDALSEGRQVERQIVLALGLKEEPERSAVQILTDFLRPKRLLLVLDNCEHLLEASAQIAGHLLRDCADMRILATSREALGITGEAAWAVPGLAECESVQLFVERAQAVNPGFALTESSAPAVAQVCARLEGIPLAIELAAARVRVLTAEQVAARLDDYLSLLTGGSRAALPRQQTLRATLDWSHDLLSQPSRLLLARLSVFAGGWTLEAAEQVGAGGEIATAHILDLLTGLVEKSLVVAVPAGQETRYRFLETVRQYAAERLAERGETDAVRDRHLSWCLALAENAEPRLRGREQRALAAYLETEHDNLRAGLAWGAESPARAEQMLRLAGALGLFWFVRGHWAEAKKYLTAALERAAVSTMAQVKALKSLWHLAMNHGDDEAMRSLSEQQMKVSREIGDHAGEADSLTSMGNVKLGQGDLEAARSYFEQSMAICRRNENLSGEARSLHGLGHLKCIQQDWVAASSYYEQSLALRREIGGSDAEASCLKNLGCVKRNQGDLEAAHFYFTQALIIYRDNENSPNQVFSLQWLGCVARSQENWEAAHSFHEQAREICHKTGDPAKEVINLHHLGFVARFQGDWELANSYFEQSLTICRKTGNRSGEAWSLHYLATVRFHQGDLEAARSYAEESLTISREAENHQVEAWSLTSLGRVAVEQNRPVQARALFAQSLTLSRQQDYAEAISFTLAERAALALAEGNALSAARLLGAVSAALEAGAATFLPEQKDAYERTLCAVRAALGDPGFMEAWDAGRALTLDEAVQYALEKV